MFEYHRPTNLQEARQLVLDNPGARFVHGGTDILVRLKSGATAPALVSLRSLLSGIEGTWVGAGTRVSDLWRSPLASSCPAIADACHDFASVQIRNAATVGGNLCNASPAADLAPPLLVHDATARILGAAGERSLPLADFFTGPGQTCLRPGEILLGVQLGSTGPSGFLKQMRVSMDIALVSAAVSLRMDDGRMRQVRVAAGAVAPVPLRLAGVEALLEGLPPSPALLARAQQEAAAEVRPIDDQRASASYRRRITGVFVRRLLERLTTGGEA